MQAVREEKSKGVRGGNAGGGGGTLGARRHMDRDQLNSASYALNHERQTMNSHGGKQVVLV